MAGHLTRVWVTAEIVLHFVLVQVFWLNDDLRLANHCSLCLFAKLSLVLLPNTACQPGDTGGWQNASSNEMI